jgi:hypothetical protein
VECDTRIPRYRRRITVEDDQAGDEIFYSVFYPRVTLGESLSQTLRKPKP